ncbi:MAG: proton-conducting transporter membrane subunit [Desulfobacterales bacterium]
MDSRTVLVALLVIAPMVGALLCALLRPPALRSAVVLSTGFVLALAALLLIPLTPFKLSGGSLYGIDLHRVIQAGDFLLLAVILFYGMKHRHAAIIALGVFQVVMLLVLEFFLIREARALQRIICDQLALMMVLIISTVGSIICCQAIPYMKEHERHYRLAHSHQPRFFFVMLIFLGAMNGLVLFNDLTFIYFFFEATTLCSFLLIGHDRTAIATQNALRALWMNSLGGAAFILGIVAAYRATGTLELQQVLAASGSAGPGVYLPALALLCVASFVKSAQFPFQSWLLGAMVAPTPVSALLHSSTMVKVGVYMVLRLAPGFEGTLLSHSIAVFGAFCFLAGAALAVGQSNGKKVLAYSTISNLGLIFACAGLDTAEAMTAAMLLLVFHAVIKALLFLSVGAIEQRIASRDIEDMRGLYAVMPVTALIAVAGVGMMIMPPFGVLLSKWMAMQAAAKNLYVIIMVALGSALTVMYWARWAGTLMSDPFAGRFHRERQPALTWMALVPLCAAAAALSAVAPWLYMRLIVPVLGASYVPSYSAAGGILENATGSFAVLPLCVAALFGLLVAFIALRRAFRAKIVPAYLSGIQTNEPGMFKGPMNQSVKAGAKNYYLDSIFGENRLSDWLNLGAGILLTLIIGGAL